MLRANCLVGAGPEACGMLSPLFHLWLGLDQGVGNLVPSACWGGLRWPPSIFLLEKYLLCTNWSPSWQPWCSGCDSRTWVWVLRGKKGRWQAAQLEGGDLSDQGTSYSRIFSPCVIESQNRDCPQITDSQVLRLASLLPWERFLTPCDTDSLATGHLASKGHFLEGF